MTQLVGLMPVRNEEWVLPFSARAALTWVDHLALLDHASTDATPTIIEELQREYPGRVSVLSEPDPTWAEMDHRQRLLEHARELAAQYIAIVDADEVLAAPLCKKVRAALEFVPPAFSIEVPLLNCWRSLDTYRDDEASLYGCSWATLVVHDAPGVISWQAAEDGYQHHARAPRGAWPGMRIPPSDRSAGGLLHLQHASWRRMAAKQGLYVATEVLRWPHRPRAGIQALYGAAFDEGDACLLPVPTEWWNCGIDRKLIDLDAAPWQERELQRLLAEHGDAELAGMDLFEDRR